MHKFWQNIYRANYISGYNPFLLKNMNKALERVVKAINEREKIIIYGSCDVDGICGSSLLLLVLKYLNADVEYYLPEEQSSNYYIDDYIVKNRLKILGTNLIITSGCCLKNKEQEDLCRELNIDIIVTDYKSNEFKSDFITINPNEKGCSYRYKNLSASGIAFKLTQALAIYYNMKCINKYIDLVLLGSCAAEVSITGENKVIFNEGLKHLRQTNNYGLKALMSLNNKTSYNEMEIRELIKILTPKLNVVGRMDNARIVVELLTTSDKDRAEQIAKYLTMELKNIVS
ncbi:DHH family phosphoesterase [Clostridium polynesiense]|uniref:DHH family phosphoesterase n=1 Tax=Clostridium polynesiense TaxID=1325933 RepID=UPI000591014A|nr:DHH family phosphoesterase [Clostridium polynesiense]